MANQCILQMNNVSKVYGNGIYANQGVSFNINEGEIHAIVGENGAGKSTLMKILFGMESCDSGEIIYRGEKVKFNSPQDAIAVGIGMVHQHFKLVESMTTTENIILGYEPTKGLIIDKKEALNKVKAIAEIFGIENQLDTPVVQLPVGTKQKIEIIKALYRGANVLILDEPTAVLTPQETEKLFEQLKELKKRKFTVIFISHKLREVKEISDRISVMRKGKMLQTVNTADVTEREISAMMVGDSFSFDLNKGKKEYQEVLLKISNITKNGAGAKPIVNGVSFTTRGGQVLGIAGVEGNGQSQLIEIITGLITADSGTVNLCGKDITCCNIAQRRLGGMAYIPSDRIEVGMAGTMSIEENLITTKLRDKSLYAGGLLSAKKITALANSLIKEYLVKCDSSYAPISMLSGGNMQKVVVARELTQNAKVIIAEQPTRGVDIGAAKFIHEELIKRRDGGCAVVLVSADMEELFKLSDSLIVMYEGKIAAFFETLDGLTEEELGYYMLGVKRQDDTMIGGAFYEE